MSLVAFQLQRTEARRGVAQCGEAGNDSGMKKKTAAWEDFRGDTHTHTHKLTAVWKDRVMT